MALGLVEKNVVIQSAKLNIPKCSKIDTESAVSSKPKTTVSKKQNFP